MRIHIISNADLEIPPAIQSWIDQHAFTVSFSTPFKDDYQQVKYDFLLILGGPQNISDGINHPYLKEIVDEMKQAIHKRIPMLGICLGAQLMGEAFGVKTEKSPYKEKGLFPVQLTKGGSLDPLFKGLPNPMPAFHWHQDMPGLPENGEILAFSEGCPRQVIRYNSLSYGMQCHLETNHSKIHSMIDLDDGFEKFVQTDQKILNGTFEEINSSLIKILNNFINIIRNYK